MTYQGFEKFYLWSIRLLLFVVPFLPLYVSSTTFFPFITGRNFAFRIIIEIAFALWLGLIVLNPQYRLRFSKLSAAVLLFGAIVFIADIFGANFYHSFWANYERMEGYMMLLHMILYFIIASSVFRIKDWDIFAHLVVFGSIGVSFYALLQKMGFLISIQGGARVDGTIGNPAYLAAYLMLAFFITLILFWNVSVPWKRYGYGAVMIFECLIIYFTATRGAILAMLGGGILFLLMYLWMHRGTLRAQLRKKSVIALVFIIITIPIVFYLSRNTEFVRTSPILQRFSAISPTDRTVQSRFIIWSMAWQGIQEHPILGWGQENFNLVFNKYYRPELWPQEPWFDRSHDIIFDWLSNAGILGLLSYLSLFVCAFVLLRHLYRNGRINILTFITAVVGFSAYFFQNLFVFDNFNSYFIFFGVLGTIHYFNTPPQPLENHSGQNNKQDRLGRAMVRSFTALCVGGLCMMGIIYFANIRPIYQSQTLIQGLHASGNQGPKDVQKIFQDALAYNSFGNAETREQYLQYASNVSGASQFPEADRVDVLKDAVHQMELQTEASPGDIRYILFLANVGYARLGAFDASYLQKALDMFLKAIDLSPKKQASYFGLVQLYLNTGQYEQAFKVSKFVRDLDSSYPTAQLFTAVSGIYAKHFDEAADAVAMYQKQSNRPEDLQFIINAYVSVGRLDLVEPIYRDLVTRFPNKAEYHARLTEVYGELGMKNEAQAEAAEVMRLDPDNYGKEIQMFLKQKGF